MHSRFSSWKDSPELGEAGCHVACADVYPIDDADDRVIRDKNVARMQIAMDPAGCIINWRGEPIFPNATDCVGHFIAETFQSYLRVLSPRRQRNASV